MRKQPNYICMLKNLLRLCCIWTWDTCGVFFLCNFVLLYASRLMRQLQNNIWGTISRIGGWGTNTKIIKTENSFHLKLEVFIFYFVLFYFILYIFFLSFTYFFLFLSLLFLFFIFNPLSVSLMPFQLMVDYYAVSRYLYLWNFFCLFLCFVLFSTFICFSLFL
jgi:hypothetical protein